MQIIGHKKIISFLDKCLEKDNLSHAYLFTGPEHVGKFTVALDWAEKILGNIKETNPDLVIIRPKIEEVKGITKKKDINVEIIREILRKISISPTKGKNKIIIIDDADYLNIASQNALLKTLEEPPEKVILILVTPNSQKLLPTIISRCLIKKFNLVSDNELREITQEKKILFWSAGRPGLARIYLEKNNELEKAEDILEDLKKIANSTISEKFSLAETWSKNTPELLEKLAQWMLIFRHSIISGENPLGLPAEKRVQIMIKTGEMMETLKTTNANTRLVMENLMLEF